MSKPQPKPQPKPLPLQRLSRQEAVPLPRDVPQIRPFTPDRQMPDVARGLPQTLTDRQMPTPPPQQGTPEQRNAMLAYQQANYPIGLGGYLGQPMGPQFGGPKLGYLGSETQLGMGPQFGGIASGMQDFTSAGQQDEMRKKMMESLLAYNRQLQANMQGGFGQPM